MNVRLGTPKHFESAVGFPVDFVIGCGQSGKVLIPQGCYMVKSLSAFTLNALHRLLHSVHCKYSVSYLSCDLVVAL